MELVKPTTYYKKKSSKSKDTCEYCGEIFTIHSELQRHLTIHVGQEKPFKCVVCKSSFRKKETLQRHFLTHTGEKSFECSVCFKAFARKDYVMNHMKRFHKLFL